MPDKDETTMCVFCKKGYSVNRMERMAFQQSSDKGYVHCRVMVPIGICNSCGAKSWDVAAEKILNVVFQRE